MQPDASAPGCSAGSRPMRAAPAASSSPTPVPARRWRTWPPPPLTLLTLLLLTPLLAWLPQAALGAVVLVGAARMIDVVGLRRLWRIRRRDLAMAVVTCAGVLFAGVLPGIAVGVLVSLVEVLRRAVMPPTAVLGELAGHSTWRDVDHHDTDTEPGLLVYRFDAPLFFANAAVLRNEIVRLVDRAQPPVRRVVLDAEGVLDVDVSGGEALDALLDDLYHRGVHLVIARARTSTQAVLRRVGITERLAVTRSTCEWLTLRMTSAD